MRLGNTPATLRGTTGLGSWGEAFALARRRGTAASEVVAELVREADDRALLAYAEKSWQQLGGDPKALAAYRAEIGELHGWDTPLPEY